VRDLDILYNVVVTYQINARCTGGVLQSIKNFASLALFDDFGAHTSGEGVHRRLCKRLLISTHQHRGSSTPEEVHTHTSPRQYILEMCARSALRGDNYMCDEKCLPREESIRFPRNFKGEGVCGQAK